MNPQNHNDKNKHKTAKITRTLHFILNHNHRLKKVPNHSHRDVSLIKSQNKRSPDKNQKL